MSNRKEQPTFEQFLLKKAERNERSSKQGEDARACVSVQMTRRHRAQTVSDRFGYFSPYGTLGWIDESITDHQEGQPAREAVRSMHFLAVLRKAVLANLSAMITGQVQVTAEPAVNDPSAPGVAAVCRGVISYLEGHREFWSQRLETQIAGQSQLGYGYFIRTRHDGRGRGEEVFDGLEFAEEMLETPGEYACACGAGGPFFSDSFAVGVTTDEASGTATIPCPDCGSPAAVLSEPVEEPQPVPVGVKTRNAGKLVMSVHPHFEFRVDEDADTAGGNLAAARWFEYHHLVAREELERDNPDFDVGEAEEWSFPLRWLHALKNNEATLSRFDNGCDVFEVREIYLRPEDYATYTVPPGGAFVLEVSEGNPLLDAEGAPVFEIGEGERPIDRFPDGFRYRLKGRQVLPGRAEDPGIAAADHRTEWSYGGFNPDPYSFWRTPLIELLTIQDDIVDLFSIDIEFRKRNAKSNLVYDGQMFDSEDFETDFTPSKQPLEPNDDINRHWGLVPAPKMDSALQGLAWLVEFGPQFGTAPPVALGAADQQDQTFGGQRLKHQRSLQLLSPYGQSKAEAKVEAFRQLIVVAQSAMPDEWFRYLSTRLGVEWREQDVQNFRDADLERIIKWAYVEGSEVPQTSAEREEKMGLLLNLLLTAIPALREAGEFAPDLRNLLSKYGEVARIDYDWGDAEGQNRLSESRYELMKERLAGVGEGDAEGFFVAMEHPKLWPVAGEEPLLCEEFWTDKARALLAEPEPDFVLVAACDEMTLRHRGEAVREMQEAAKGQLAAEAPLREAAAEEQAAAEEAEAGRAEGERAAAASEKSADHSHQAALKAMEIGSKERLATQGPSA